MATRSIGTLTVDLVAKMGGFEEGMGKVDRRMKKTADNIDRQAKRAAKALAGMGIAAVAGTAALLVSQANAADELIKTSRIIGVQVDALAGLKYGAELSGVGFGGLTSSLTKFNKTISEAREGTGLGVDAFDALGISLTDNNGRFKETEELLDEVANKFSGMQDGVQKTALAQDLMGRSGAQMINLLNGGSEGIAAMTAEAESFGLIIDEKTAVAAENFNDSLTKIKFAAQGAGNEMLTTLSPIMNDFSEVISDPQTIEGIKSLVGGIGTLTTNMVKFLSTVSSVTKFLAEETAAAIHGVAFDDIIRINDEILELEEKIEKLENRKTNRGNKTQHLLQAKQELAVLQEMRKSYDETAEAAIKVGKAKDAINKVGEDAVETKPKIINLNKELRHSFNTLQEIYNMQNDEFGFADPTDAFSFEDFGATADNTADSVTGIGTAYTKMGSIASGVMSNLITDTANGSLDIRETIKTMLTGIAADVASNEIALQFSAQVTDSNSTADSSVSETATSSWWGAIIAAVYVVGNVRNDSEKERWEEFTSEYRQGVQGTGTILGDINASSHSLFNLTEDISSDNLAVLDVNYAMLSTLVDIRTGITGVADGFAKTGFGDAGAAAFANVELGRVAVDDRARHNVNTFAAQLSNPSGGSLLSNLGSDLPLANFFDEADGFLIGIMDEVSSAFLHDDTSITDSGIEIFGGSLQSIIDGGVLDAQSYADALTERKLIGINIGTDLDTLTESLDDIAVAQLSGVFANVGELLGASALQFGIESGEYMGQLFVDGGRLSLKDLDASEASAAIESFLSSQFDTWGEIILDGTSILHDFQLVGEGAFETMLRLSSQTASFVDAANKLNLNFDATELDAVYQSQGLASAAGGQDALTQLLSTYSNAFISDSIRFEQLEESLTSVFESLGEQLPTTAQLFRDMVQEQEFVTEAGQEQLAMLLSLSGATDDYLRELERQNDEEQRLRDDETRTRDNGLDAWRRYLSEQDRLMQQIADVTTGALGNLRNAINGDISILDNALDARISGIDIRHDTAANSLNKWLDTQKNLFTTQGDRLSDSISGLTSLSSTLQGAMESLRVDSFDINGQRFSAAQNDIAALLGTANAGGGLPDAEILRSLTGDLAGGEQFFGSFEEYNLAIGHTLNDLAQLQSITGEKLTTEEQLLNQVKINEENAAQRAVIMGQRNDNSRDESIAAAQQQHDAQVALLEAQYTQFENSVNELNGIQENTLNTEAAINQLREAIDAQRIEQLRQSAEEFVVMREHLEEIVINTASASDQERQDYYAGLTEDAA